MAKRNWSRSEANNDRKTHAARYAAKQTRYRAGTLAVTVDLERVRLAFATTPDARRTEPYQPPIVGKSICR